MRRLDLHSDAESHTREVRALLERCKVCRDPVALPTSAGMCIYCHRRAAPKGTALTPWPAPPDPGPEPG